MQNFRADFIEDYDVGLDYYGYRWYWNSNNQTIYCETDPTYNTEENGGYHCETLADAYEMIKILP